MLAKSVQYTPESRKGVSKKMHLLGTIDKV